MSSVDASWIAYDKTLGPQLRKVGSLSTQYYGFDTSKPPFDDVRVRQAFGEAVDWRRIAALSGTSETVQVANSMVPPGIPGRSDADFLPNYDPADARKLLAEAGYPGGAGFPDTVLMTGGSGFDEAIVSELKRELGITLRSETMGDGYFDRLGTDLPAMWSLAWVADYPGRNDFLGVLLGTGASNNYGHWSSAAFDAAIAEAGSATDPAVASAAYDRAEAHRPATRSRSSRSPTGRAGRCRGPGCSGRARTASASCAWRGWRGRTDAAPAARRCVVDRLAACSASRRSPARRRRHGPTSAPRPRRRRSRPGSSSASRSPSRSAAGRVELLLTERRRDRPDGHRGPEPAGGRVGDADLSARPGRRAHPRRTRRWSPAGG